MITLNASGSSVTFTFDGNSTYLNDGTITVPVNSLALIIDESDFVTFKKSHSNDIFVSANIAEFGMTKAELESWYKENMVGSTGGGGGVTTGEVQTMIDESISGKANSSDVYTTGQTSGATEIANALNAKLDTTAYTPTVVDAALSQSSTNPVQNQALYGELRVGGGTSKVEIDFNTGGYVPEGVTQLEVNPTTTDSWAYYNFYNGNTKLGSYNFTNWGSFNVGNHLEGSSYVISGETVIITYPASLGVTRIAQDGGNAPWSFEAIVETPAVPLKDVVSGKADSSAVTEEISEAVSGKVETNTYTAYTANTQTVLNSKLDATAYTPVQVSTAITENDTNAVAGGAVYDKVHVTSGNGSTTLLTFAEPTGPSPWYMASNYPSGVTKFNIELDLTQWGRYNPTLGFHDNNNNDYAGQIINTDGVITYVDVSDSMYSTSMSATTSYTNNVFTIEVTGLSGDAPSGLTMFRLTNKEPVVNAYAIEGESVEYWIKDYVDAKIAELLNQINNS